MSQTGSSWKIKRIALGSSYHVGGKNFGAEPSVRTSTIRQAGTGTHALVYHGIKDIMPSLTFNMKLQRLSNFVADHTDTNKFCFVSAEGALDSYTVVTTDGLNTFQHTSSVTDSCTVTIPRNEPITVDVRLFSMKPASSSYGSDPSAITDAVLVGGATNLDTMTLGGTNILADFITSTMVVNHNTQQLFYGTEKIPRSVKQRETSYSGRIERALRSNSWRGTSYDGTEQDIVIQINDNQTPSAEKTEFTFSDAKITAYAEPVRELGMILERIDWESDSLTLAAGT